MGDAKRLFLQMISQQPVLVVIVQPCCHIYEMAVLAENTTGNRFKKDEKHLEVILSHTFGFPICQRL